MKSSSYRRRNGCNATPTRLREKMTITINKLGTIAFVVLLALAAAGCGVQKVVALPLRVTGAAVSVVPVVGDAAHGALDATADVID